MSDRAITFVGVCILLAAVLHAFASNRHKTASEERQFAEPIQTGRAAMDISTAEPSGGSSTLSCKDCLIECYETHVVVHLDREKAPTWTENYVVVVPWSDVVGRVLLKPET